MTKPKTRLEKLIRALKTNRREREERRFAQRLAYGFRLIRMVEA